MSEPGTLSGVPQQEVSESVREVPDSSQPQAVRGAGEDLVPEQESQVEESQGRDRTRRTRGGTQQQDRGAYTSPCQQVSHKQTNYPTLCWPRL